MSRSRVPGQAVLTRSIGLLVVLAMGCGVKDRSDQRVLGQTEPGSMTGELNPEDSEAAGGESEQSEEGSGESGPDVEGLDSSGEEEPPTQTTQLLAQGTACVSDAECETGFCTDGVCCDTRCGEVCALCSAAGSEGTCGPAESDAQCDVLSCPAASDCRSFDTSGAELNCTAFGTCRDGVECAIVDAPLGTPCREGAGECDGAGQCVVPDTATLGEACAEDFDCGSGHCVVGPNGQSLCCETPCDGVCEQCSTEGRCDGAPATDERCAAVDCPGDNICLDYPEDITTDLCRSRGQCRSQQDCEPIVLRASADCECDATGACGLTRGIACQGDADCSSGVCSATPAGTRACCAERCGAGLTCSSDGLRCVECEGSAITCEGGLAVRCEAGRVRREECPLGCVPGAGCSDRAPVGGSCAQAECVVGAVCAPDVNGQQRCCARDCQAEGRTCAVDGSCVCPPGQTQSAQGNCLLQQGDPCGNGTCAGGLTCVDGVCCDTACGEACESCNLPGSVGQCSFNGNDNSACAPGQQCVDQGQCGSPNGERCEQAGQCLSGNCEPLVGVNGALVCCAQQCAGQRDSCSSIGDRCVECQSAGDCQNGCGANGLCNPLVIAGGNCTLNNQCAAGSCVQAEGGVGRRCCSGCQQGQVCSQSGQCVNPPSSQGQPCGGGQQCGAGLQCVDGVCCNAACNRACESCNVGNSVGQCVFDPGDDALCGGGQECSARNQCVPRSAQVGESCANGEACQGLRVECLAGTCRQTRLLGESCSPTDVCQGDSECTDGTCLGEPSNLVLNQQVRALSVVEPLAYFLGSPEFSSSPVLRVSQSGNVQTLEAGAPFFLTAVDASGVYGPVNLTGYELNRMNLLGSGYALIPGSDAVTGGSQTSPVLTVRLNSTHVFLANFGSRAYFFRIPKVGGTAELIVESLVLSERDFEVDESSIFVRSTTDVSRIPAAGGDPVFLADWGAADFDTDLSLTSDRVAFANSQGVASVSKQGGASLTLDPSPAYLMASDGTSLYYFRALSAGNDCAAGSQLMRVSAAGGTPVPLTRVDGPCIPEIVATNAAVYWVNGDGQGIQRLGL